MQPVFIQGVATYILTQKHLNISEILWKIQEEDMTIHFVALYFKQKMNGFNLMVLIHM